MPASATTENDRHHLSVVIPGTVYAELQRRAEREGSPVSSITRRVLTQGLSDRLGQDARIREGDASQFEVSR